MAHRTMKLLVRFTTVGSDISDFHKQTEETSNLGSSHRFGLVNWSKARFHWHGTLLPSVHKSCCTHGHYWVNCKSGSM